MTWIRRIAVVGLASAVVGCVLLFSLWYSYAAEGATYLQCDQLTESSGLAVSTADPQIVWTHNDSGDSARLYGFTRHGRWCADVRLSGARAVDWEDLCSFKRDDKHWLAVADVGDNQGSRKTVRLLLLEEPEIDVVIDPTANDQAPALIECKDYQTLEFRYPAGPADCEAIAYDPLDDSFLLGTKSHFGSRVYRLPLKLKQTADDTTRQRPQNKGEATAPESEPAEAELVQQFNLPMVTSADIRRDGQLLAIATYGPTFFYERISRPENEEQAAGSEASSPGPRRIWQQDAARVVEMPARRQGEAICFDETGSRLLLTSEFAPTPLWEVDLDAAADVKMP